VSYDAAPISWHIQLLQIAKIRSELTNLIVLFRNTFPKNHVRSLLKILIVTDGHFFFTQAWWLFFNDFDFFVGNLRLGNG
jgi:hypothetical protein